MGNVSKKSVTGWESPTAFHPGVFLADILKDLSMTQSELAERISLSKKAVNEIIKGKTAVTRSTAHKLSRALPLSEQYWVNAQNIYEQDKARLEEEKQIPEACFKLLSSQLRQTTKKLIFPPRIGQFVVYPEKEGRLPYPPQTVE